MTGGPNHWARRGPRARSAAVGLVAAVLLAAGCAGTPLDYAPQPGFNLTGNWELVPELSDQAPTRSRLRSRGSMIAFVTQDFPVLRAQRMHIEQNRDSMGVEYDGREYRDVSWGVRQRGLWEVEAGWLEGNLVILSEAPDGEAQETFALSPDGQMLTIDIRVSSGSENFAVTRIFSRT
jgi:hypothetical protein